MNMKICNSEMRGWVAQLVKPLPSMCLLPHYWGDREKRFLGACRPGILTEFISSEFRKRLCLKN